MFAKLTILNVLLMSIMDEWLIPAKTFLVGEYVALDHGPAIIITTTPHFKLRLTTDSINTQAIHPQSPAGRFWATYHNLDKFLSWEDPYHAIGGLGASSAQFLGAFFANCTLLNIKPELNALLETYYKYSWHGKGPRPSGYDLLAQAQAQCVYINLQHQIIQIYPWVFSELDFILIYTGTKLITHQYLESIPIPQTITNLIPIVNNTIAAFEHRDSQKLIDSVTAYQQQLTASQLTTPQSVQNLKTLLKNQKILAAKGCGAMGADILLLLIAAADRESILHTLTDAGWMIIACSQNLCQTEPMVER